MLHVVRAIVIALAILPGGLASAGERGRAMVDLLRLDAMIAIMRVEGIAAADELRAEMFPGRNAATWPAMMDRLYDVDAMALRIEEALEADLTEADADAIRSFFESPRGQRIVDLEIAARRAFLDPMVEAAAGEGARRADDDGRRRLLDRFEEVNQLVELNVASSMNATYAFYHGLALSTDPDGPIAEELLQQVWVQEERIRSETEDWVRGFLTLAYGPLSEPDLEAYIALSSSPAGQALNRALFRGFDGIFTDISEELGQIAGRHVASEDI